MATTEDYGLLGSLFVTTNQSLVTTEMETTNPPLIHVCYDLRNAPAFTDSIINYRIIMNVYILPWICAVGIVGNILSFAVLWRDRIMKRTTTFLLQVLALTDTLFLLVSLVFQTVETISTLTGWSKWLQCHYRYIEQGIYAVGNTIQTFSVWLVLIVTTDRWIAICMPLRAPRYSTMSRMRKAVLATLILAILYNIPKYFEFELITYKYPTHHFHYSRTTEFSRNYHYVLIYETILYFIFRFALPIGALIFFNIRLAQSIRSSSKERAEMTNQKSADTVRATLTLVVIVTVFVICAAPDYALRICRFLDRFFKEETNIDVKIIRYMQPVGNMFLAINSSCNFIIYCLLGKRFRRIFCEMIGCKRFISTDASTTQNSDNQKTSYSNVPTVSARV